MVAVAKRNGYSSAASPKADLDLLVANAEQFNQPGSAVGFVEGARRVVGKSETLFQLTFKHTCVCVCDLG